MRESIGRISLTASQNMSCIWTTYINHVSQGYYRVAREIGSNIPSVKTYSQILEDPHLGTTLEALNRLPQGC